MIGDGTATIVLGSSVDSPIQGEGNLADLTFKGLLTGNSFVTIDAASQVSAIGSNTNVVKERQPLTITIGGTGIASPTPSPVSSCSLPAAPVGVTATAVDQKQITLQWMNQTNATHYGIVYGLKAGTYIYGAADIGSTTSFTVSQLSPYTTYYFAVFSANDCGASSFSAEASARTPGYAANYTPQPAVSTAVATPQPEFVPIDPNQTEDEVISFLNSRPAASSNPTMTPRLVLPSGYGAAPATKSPIPQLAGILLIIVGICGAIFFMRTHQS